MTDKESNRWAGIFFFGLIALFILGWAVSR